jgi:formamidopyrimidine-DNA glycosylase
MPELPDVEGFRRYFRRYAKGRRVVSITADADIVRNASPSVLDRRLRREEFARPSRHGKWLICPAGISSLLLHFGMTGELVWDETKLGAHGHDRLTIEFEDGQLHYRNMRKLGGVWLTDRGNEDTIIGSLGPDAWRISRNDFSTLLSGRRRSLKSALMDQELVAGLGNLTVDETLFHARLDPRRSVASLSEKELRTLYNKMRHVLRASIAEGLVPSKRTWITSSRSREGICPRCGTRLKREIVAGRTTYSCPSCQPAHKN